MGDGLLTFIIIISIAIVISIVAFLLYKLLGQKFKNDKPSDDEMLNDELNRILQPIDDKQTADEISNYSEKDD